MSGFSGDELRTIKACLETVRYDTDEDPDEWAEGATEHLDSIIAKIKTTTDSVIYRKDDA